MCSLFHVSWDIFAVVSDFDVCRARISGGEWNIWLPLGAFFSFCQAYLNQEFVGGSSFEVVSSHLLADRLLSLLLLVLVGSGEFVFWAMTGKLRSSEKLDVRLLSWLVGADARESVLFIGTEFSILYTSMHSPA